MRSKTVIHVYHLYHTSPTNEVVKQTFPEGLSEVGKHFGGQGDIFGESAGYGRAGSFSVELQCVFWRQKDTPCLLEKSAN